MKNLYVTGYKPNELNIFNMNDKRISFIKECIKRRLIPLIEEGIEWVIISGQAGVELWTAEVVLDLQEEYNVRLAIVPPFLNQESRWKEEQQNLYHLLLEQADFYQPLTKKEYESPSQFKLKDKWMIEKTDACLLLFDEEYGGSPVFFLREVKKQKGNNYPLFFITSYDLEDTVRDMQSENW